MEEKIIEALRTLETGESGWFVASKDMESAYILASIVTGKNITEIREQVASLL